MAGVWIEIGQRKTICVKVDHWTAYKGNTERGSKRTRIIGDEDGGYQEADEGDGHDDDELLARACIVEPDRHRDGGQLACGSRDAMRRAANGRGEQLRCNTEIQFLSQMHGDLVMRA